jgi:hypothetical protein
MEFKNLNIYFPVVVFDGDAAEGRQLVALRLNSNFDDFCFSQEFYN